MSGGEDNLRPAPDGLLRALADYVCGETPASEEALATARLCVMDALGCGLAALAFPACQSVLGPVVPGIQIAKGARVPGTGYELDPVTAAFNLGAMIRWLDYNDTWLAAEWGHPSDNLGGILALADWLARNADEQDKPTMGSVLRSLTRAYEIQGVLALENSFNRAGLDHVLLVKVATAGVTARMLGCTGEQVVNALSNAWVDGQPLRTYRHAPNTGRRKSWAAGDQTSRGVWLALMARRGEMGYPSALTAPRWGFQDALFRGQEVRLGRALGSYVMENILFKVSFPAEFHAQTAVEAALRLHAQVAGRLEEIERVEIRTQESALRIIDKRGPLYNPADRDHCIQYMTAIGLIFGKLSAEHYEGETAGDPRVDRLREKMVCVEDERYSREYLEAEKRSIANAVQVFFQDGSQTEKSEVEYPLGHRRRRGEALPLLYEKFRENASGVLLPERVEHLLALFRDAERLDEMYVDEFVDLFVTGSEMGNV